MKIKIGLVDDHQLFLKSLALMLETLKHFEVVIEALNGQDLQKKISTITTLPDIIIIDVNMPIMNGTETAYWLHERYPTIKLVALSMNEKDKSILKMFKAGCCSYILKDIHPNSLEKALLEINSKGYHNTDVGNINFGKLLNSSREEMKLQLSDRELKFLQLACSDLTYKQIASEMNLSERTIDGYREALFQRFSVQSRVGLCLEAIRKEIISL
jgi:DNA-binding NarL/FixJ family response regulator